MKWSLIRLAVVLCPLALLLLAMQPLSAQDNQAERISDFHSDITVRPDSSMQVVETITVYAAHQQINHGIYRDFPTSYRDRLGNRYVVRFNVLSVLRDGSPEPYHTVPRFNGIRVYMGSEDRSVDIGRHSYTLTYETNRQLGYFKDHDELYWNVTGNGWIFPIEQASATVTLPVGITGQQMRIEAYTGAQGATGRAYQALIDESNRAQFVTTAPLASNEGLTIVVSFPKGFVRKPSPQQQTEFLLKDNKNLSAGLIGLLLVSGYFIIVWSMVGCDPEKGVIIPLYAPPEGLSPAAMRFIRTMGYDNKAFAATIINAAVKGVLTIGESKVQQLVGSEQVFSVRQTDLPLQPALLASEEETLITLLFSRLGSIVVFENSYYTAIKEAIEAFTTALKDKYQHRLFSLNLLAFIPGAVLSAIAVIVVCYYTLSQIQDLDVSTFFFALLLSGGPVLIFALYGFPLWQKVYSQAGNLRTTLLKALFITLAFIIVFSLSLWYFGAAHLPLLLIMLVFAGVNVLFFHLMKAPTTAGRRLMDKIEGFRLYLVYAEKDDMNLRNPPEKTPALFEAFLPYALALDVEQAWSSKFASVLAQSTIAGQAYHPGWYYGPSWNSFSDMNFVTSLGDSFSSAISSSTTTPGSTSGSSDGFSDGGFGGGFSGGGSGGGGGGGW